MRLAEFGVSFRRTTYQVGDHDLALTARWGGTCRSCLGLLGLLCGLLNTANGGSGSSRTAGLRATAAAALTGGLLPRADDRLEGLVEARFRHDGGE
jgi:hypothetical protein